MGDLTPLPLWKRLLSYLVELHIESDSSEYNPHLYVSLYRGQYQLSTANAVYSYGERYSNYLRTFQQFNWAKGPVDDVLLLGLGLGSIPMILEKKLLRTCHYTAVEIDEVVIDLASRYGLYDLQSSIELICADAEVFIYQARPASYDLICMDVFEDDAIPPVFESPDFLQAMARCLRPGGVILYNRLAATHGDKSSSRRFYNKYFYPTFPQGCLLDVKGNYMLVSDQAWILP